MSITLLKWAKLYDSLNILWHCPSLGLQWKLTFSSPVATAEFFQICCHIECSTLTSFRILNSSAEIPSVPLALFIVMLSKAHLTSDSRMSGSNWVTTPSWLSRSLKPFIYCSSVHSCHIFLISFVSVTTSYCFVLYCAHSCTKCSFDIPYFIELISCLSHSIFPLFLCIVHLRKLAYLSLLLSGTQLNAGHS